MLMPFLLPKPKVLRHSPNQYNTLTFTYNFGKKELCLAMYIQVLGTTVNYI